MIRTSTKIKTGIYITIACTIIASIYLFGSVDMPQFTKSAVPKGFHRNLSGDVSLIKKSVCEDRGINLSEIDPEQMEDGVEYRTTIREGWRKENKLQKIIMGEDADFGGQVGDLIPIIAPFAAFSVLSFLGYWFYCLCQCCPDSCCPPCKCCAGKDGRCCGCQCDMKKPYEGFCLYYPIVGMFIALGFIAITAIIGLGTTGGVEEGYDRMQCAIISSMDAINYGDEGYKSTKVGFMGVRGFQDKLSNLATEVGTTFKDRLNTAFNQDTSWIASAKTDMDAELNKMREVWPGGGDGDGSAIGIMYTNSTKTITYDNTPNALNDGLDTTKLSCYFSSVSQNEAAYLSNCGTITGNAEDVEKWEKVVELTQAVIDESIKPTITATEEIEKIGKDIDADITNFENAIKDGAKAMQDLESDFNKQIEDVNKNLNDGGKYIKDYVTPNLEIAYGAFIGISLLLGLIAALMIIFKMYCLRHFLTIFWGLFAWLAFVLLLVGSVLLVVNLAGAEICDFFYRALNDSTEFGKIDAFKGEPSKHMTTCTKSLGGNGKMMDNFDMKDQFKQLEDMDNQMADSKQKKEEGQTGMTNLENYVNGLSEQLNNLIDTGKADGLYDSQHIAAAVTKLEEYANTHCAKDDKWIFSREEACPATYSWIYTDHVYITDVSDNTSAKDMDSAGTKQCIWWNGMPQVVASPPAGEIPLKAGSDFTIGFGQPGGLQYGPRGSDSETAKQRYRGCTAGAGKQLTIGAMNRLMDWRDTKNKLVQYKYDQTRLFDNAFKAYKAGYNGYMAQLGTFETATKDLTSGITDTKTGLIADDATNCLFIGESLHNFNNQMCSVFFVEFYSLTKTLHWFGFGLCFASLFMWQTSMRFAKNMKLAKKNKVNVDGDDEKAFNNNGSPGGEIALNQPVQMNPDGTPLTIVIMNADGTTRLCPDGQEMVAMVYEDGSPVLDSDGYPVDANTYGSDGFPKKDVEVENNYERGSEVYVGEDNHQGEVNDDDDNDNDNNNSGEEED